MARKWYDSTVIRIVEETPQTKRFWIAIEGEEAFDFRAGQFITMDLPISEKRLQRWRSYSIANPPDGSRVLELCIVYLEGGAASKYLFEEVAVGSSIRFKGPGGVFVLPEVVENKLVMICTGTGVAPFRSMIYDLLKKNEVLPPIHLIFGTRTEEGILYRKEFEQLAEEQEHFKYSVALSRQPDWEGCQGYVHLIYQQEYAVPHPEVDFYLCGWSNMIDEAVAKLSTDLKYDKSQIHYELYG